MDSRLKKSKNGKEQTSKDGTGMVQARVNHIVRGLEALERTGKKVRLFLTSHQDTALY
jgi:hypothetical protein